MQRCSFVFLFYLVTYIQELLQYVGALGINSLIREAMNATSAADLSRTLYMYGVNMPVGSLPRHEAARREPRALLFDCTHDNPTPAQKRTPEDFLSVCVYYFSLLFFFFFLCYLQQFLSPRLSERCSC